MNTKIKIKNYIELFKMKVFYNETALTSFVLVSPKTTKKISIFFYKNSFSFPIYI